MIDSLIIPEPVAWELRQGKTDRVLIQITNNRQLAFDWKASLHEAVPLFTLEQLRTCIAEAIQGTMQ
jgi:hypothetical protein